MIQMNVIWLLQKVADYPEHNMCRCGLTYLLIPESFRNCSIETYFDILGLNSGINI